ncbi:quinone oxidoreductase [Neorhizobium sp. NCHU2750]|uniref:quinone oxidoreductase family protein n=1 Tax=Neorhizobium sp. NCHU2750 TaxID=1825976 RepID=UPI000E75E5BC|nr:quinone oxidoreductase [Neorhizobium sp. NCHU2750]
MSDREIHLMGCGGTEKLEIHPQPPLHPGAGEILVRHRAIGMNFVDIYHRIGTYPLAAYPAIPGVEAAGIVEEVGPDVTGIAPGDRVAYGATLGAYASTRLLPAHRAILLPDDISFQAAAASMLKAMTAYMLLHRTYPVCEGTVVLVHAAAGGLGAIMVRWAKQLGAIVIGTVGTEEKAVLAKQYGADHVIVGRNADIAPQVKELTGGRGVDVAYDGIGGSTLARSIAATRAFGTIASFGQPAGPIPPIEIETLRPGKSLTLPSIMAHAADPANYREAAEAAIEAMRQGMAATIAGEFPLDDVAKAQTLLESGSAAGSLLLIP